MECTSKLKTLACPPPLKPAAEKGLLTPEELEAAIPAVLDLGRAHFTSQCLYTVVALGVPDVIGTRTLSIAEIVSSLACPVNEDLLLRQLRVVAAAGALVESAGEQGVGVQPSFITGRIPALYIHLALHNCVAFPG